MENKLYVKMIGHIEKRGDDSVLCLNKELIPALTGLEGFGALQIIWWFHGCDNAAARAKSTEDSPYRKGPAVLGTFATRAPERPNPIALSCADVTYIDAESGEIGLAYIDAEEGSPVLDIKPYTPSLDRVEHPVVPAWCAHWPQSTETSGDFDWESEMNF